MSRKGGKFKKTSSFRANAIADSCRKEELKNYVGKEKMNQCNLNEYLVFTLFLNVSMLTNS